MSFHNKNCHRVIVYSRNVPQHNICYPFIQRQCLAEWENIDSTFFKMWFYLPKCHRSWTYSPILLLVNQNAHVPRIHLLHLGLEGRCHESNQMEIHLEFTDISLHYIYRGSPLISKRGSQLGRALFQGSWCVLSPYPATPPFSYWINAHLWWESLCVEQPILICVCVWYWTSKQKLNYTLTKLGSYLCAFQEPGIQIKSHTHSS